MNLKSTIYEPTLVFIGVPLLMLFIGFDATILHNEIILWLLLPAFFLGIPLMAMIGERLDESRK